MTFSTPWALAGLVLAGIPIILHLLARREPPTVVFPATRYLADATRLHQRRLQLEHLVLLVLRTLLIAALVLAAAGPRWPKSGIGAHPPAALVLILDNSLSSGAIQGGVPVLDGLVAAARAVFDRATPDDRLWLITADGIPRAGTADALAAQLDSVVASSRRLDLGAAVARASDIVAAQSLPGEIVVVSDLQRSALAGSVVTIPMTVLRPAEAPPANAGLSGMTVGAQPWGADGGTAGITVAGIGTAPRPVTVVAGNRPVRQLLIPVGGQGTQRITGLSAGWWTVEAELDPDELRTDDARRIAVRVAPAARVQWSAEDRFIATAADVLVQNGRIVPGGEVALGPVTAGASVVIPPRDPAQLGAVNRALAARGANWRFGDLTVLPTTTDSGAWIGRVGVARRYRLTFQGGAPTDVLVTAGGEPWMVRSGRLVLIASRLEPEWTTLPVSAGFVPFLDGVLNRASRGEGAQLSSAPGDAVAVPDRVTSVAQGDQRWPIEGGALFRPQHPSPHFLLAGSDTIGVLNVNPDPRESDLVRATDDEVRALWPEARIGEPDRAGALAFHAGATSDLRGLLLLAALLLGLAEVALASAVRAKGRA